MHPSSKRYHETLKEAGELHDKKGKDYGSDTDPFANVRAADEFGVPPWVGVAIRMNDKMQRIKVAASRAIATGDVTLANESLEDSFRDLQVYSGIGLVLLEEWLDQQKWLDQHTT